jgi:hypothetical protein
MLLQLLRREEGAGEWFVVELQGELAGAVADAEVGELKFKDVRLHRLILRARDSCFDEVNRWARRDREREREMERV